MLDSTARRMKERDWVTTPETAGEMPVKVHPGPSAEFVLGFADGVRVESFDLPERVELVPGDVCILTARVVGVERDRDPVEISIEVDDVELVIPSPRRGETDVDEMMKHLDAARERRQRTEDENRCDNCRQVDGSTDLSVERRVGGRDLHYCAECDRLLSTREYDQWVTTRLR